MLHADSHIYFGWDGCCAGFCDGTFYGFDHSLEWLRGVTSIVDS